MVDTLLLALINTVLDFGVWLVKVRIKWEELKREKQELKQEIAAAFHYSESPITQSMNTPIKHTFQEEKLYDKIQIGEYLFASIDESHNLVLDNIDNAITISPSEYMSLTRFVDFCVNQYGGAH